MTALRRLVLGMLATGFVLAAACDPKTSTAPGDGKDEAKGDDSGGSKLPPGVADQLDKCLGLMVQGEAGDIGSREAMGNCQALAPLTPEVDAHLQAKCDDKDGAACHVLGDALRGERIVKYVGELVRAACGPKETCDLLLRHYAVSSFGEAKADDAARSNGLLERACELGRGDACVARAAAEKNITVKTEWMARGCAQGVAAGCAHSVHHAIMFGGADVAPATVTKLHELCDAGRASACTSLGVLVARGNKQAKAVGKPALDLWASACTGGSLGGCASVVFHALQNKKADPTQRDAAAQALTAACKEGQVGPECTAAAFAMFRGWSIAQNKAAARAWLKKNCDADIDSACDVPKK
jgi:TPR repeat protein